MNLIRRKYAKRLFAAGILFYALSGMSSVLNYLFYPLIARYVSVHEYGEIQFLTTMFTQLSVGFVVLNMLSIVVSIRSKDSQQEKDMLSGLNSISIIITLLIVLIGILVLTLNLSSLGLSSKPSIIILGLGIIATVPLTVSLGKLQGNNMFVSAGVIGVLVAFFKIIFSLLFIMAGLGVAGALLGITIGIVIGSLAIKLIELRTESVPRKTSGRFSFKNIALILPIRKTAVALLFTILTITLLSTADSVVSRLVLDPTEAGRYASIATVAKITLAITSPIMWLVIPLAIRLKMANALRYITKALLIAVPATLLFCMFPEFFTSTLIGVDATGFIQLMPMAAIAMLLCATAFILLSIVVCAGYIRLGVLSTIFALFVFFATFIVSRSDDLLINSLYGQLFASLSYIVLLLPNIIRESRLKSASND